MDGIREPRLRPKPPMTAAEFLAWEARQETKWEFDGIGATAMNGGTRAHAVISSNILTALSPLRTIDGGCRAYGSELKIATERGFRYPDVVISCADFADTDTIVPEPVVIFEILSESTGSKDRTVKLREYQALPSVRQCILVEQDRPFLNLIERTNDGWSCTVLGPDDSITLAGVPFALRMSDVFFGLNFPEPSGPDKADA